MADYQWLEDLIDEAGREAVFERARTYGWGHGSNPPSWVWADIAREVKAGAPPSAPPPRGLDEAILGFRLF
jgi:hypothetical protein